MINKDEVQMQLMWACIHVEVDIEAKTHFGGYSGRSWQSERESPNEGGVDVDREWKLNHDGRVNKLSRETQRS